MMRRSGVDLSSIGSGNLGKFVATLRGHVGPVYRLTWSADSRMVVSASKDATVKVCISALSINPSNCITRYGTLKHTKLNPIYPATSMKYTVSTLLRIKLSAEAGIKRLRCTSRSLYIEGRSIYGGHRWKN